MSLMDIAATVDVSRTTIECLARDYGLPIREPGGRSRTTVDREWLYEQYVNNRRTLPDLAAEAGMSAAIMARWEQAIFWFETAVSDPAGQRGRSGVVENQAFSTWLPRKHLALCYFQIGDYDNSLRHNRIAQSYQPGDQEIAANIAMLEALIAERDRPATAQQMPPNPSAGE